MKRFFIFCGLIFLQFNLFAQQVEPIILDSVIVSGNKATSKTPISFTSVTRGELASFAPNNSLPVLLNLQPSVVATTEAGSGLGYSKLSVRGSDATRINVTLNGVTINDAESQEVFWVNIPALSSILQSVQLQRGIGTSMNGTGSFGGSINMQTLFSAPKPYGMAEVGYGSFNTTTTTIGAGSGLLPCGFSFDLRYSHNSTDGYVRNGKGKLNSLFASLGYLKGNNAFKLNYILGDQHTGITWEGVSKEMLEKDRRFNPAGMYYDDAGNVKYYDNETDNYTQHYLQAFYSHQFNHGFLWVNTLNYTRGDGYYENYKYNTKFSKYGLLPQTIGGEVYKKSDFIIRQAMANNYYVASSTLKYNALGMNGAAGVTYSYYDGYHFGNLLWSKYNENIKDNYQWYDNTGDKWEVNAFARFEIDLSKFTLFADLQYRHIDLKMDGEDKDFASLKYDRRFDFFNPKAGVTFALNKSNTFYASIAIGNKEPSRSDVKEAIKSGRGDDIKAESMYDVEIGYKLNRDKFAFGANLYFMEYKDQLVATGKLSDVGYEIKENVPYSYRRGIELLAGWKIIRQLQVDGNVTLSLNKIKEYTAWIDTFDNHDNWNQLPQTKEYYKETFLTMSPSLIGMLKLTYSPIKNGHISLNGKYVGKQYYDNTSCQERSLPGYFVMNGDISYSIPLNKSLSDESKVTISLFVDNILNNKYISNAWVYRAFFKDGSEPYLDEGFYPQATTNFIVKLALNF